MTKQKKGVNNNNDNDNNNNDKKKKLKKGCREEKNRSVLTY